MSTARVVSLRAERQRRRAAQRKREYRHRLAAGVVVVPVPVSRDVIGMLLDLHWLPVEASEDRSRIGDAIARLLDDAAKRT